MATKVSIFPLFKGFPTVVLRENYLCFIETTLGYDLYNAAISIIENFYFKNRLLQFLRLLFKKKCNVLKSMTNNINTTSYFL